MALLSIPIINIGTTPDDGTGDKLRTSFTKVNTAITTLNNSLATNIYSVVQVNSFSVGSIIQSSNTGYALATATSGFCGVVVSANSGSFSFATSGIIPLSGIVQGQTYWISTTVPGTYTATQPSSNAVPVLLGIDLGQAEVLPYIVQTGTSGGGAVTSVAGRTGAVTLAYADISGLGTAAQSNTSAFDAAGTAVAQGNLCLKISNNLSDISNLPAALVNLGLNNVNNTSDANKPISTATQTALNAKVNISGAVTSVAGRTGAVTLAYADISGLGTAAQSNTSAFATPASVAACLQVSNNLSDLGSTATALTNLGLNNVNNTSDANKPISTATQTALNAKLSLSGGTMTGLLTLYGSPSGTNDAATKGYVDQAVQGISWKNPVVAVATTNINISNPGTAVFDGVTLTSGQRLGLVSQSTASQNGIWQFNGSSSALTRTTDFASGSTTEAINATFYCSLGTTNANKGYTCTTDPATIDTTALTFVNFTAATGTVTSVGLTVSGYSIANSPVTTSGTIAATPSFTGLAYATSGTSMGAATANQVAAALTGTTGTLNLASATLTLPTISDSGVGGVTVFTLSSGTAINWSNGLWQQYTLSSTSLSPTFSNPVTGKTHILTIINTSGSTATITLPTGTGYAPASTVTVTASQRLNIAAIYDGSKYHYSYGANLITL